MFFKQIPNFGIKQKDSVWMSGLLDQLKIISDKEFDELVADHSMKEYFRLHPLEFGPGISALTEKDFSFIPKEFLPKSEDCKYWQFQISKANGRVVGFFNSDNTVFYIVFLDPNHNAQLSDYSDYKVRPIEPETSEIDDLYLRVCKQVDLGLALNKQGAEALYSGDNVYLCIDKELFSPFDSLMKDGTLQAKLQEFLMDNI